MGYPLSYTQPTLFKSILRQKEVTDECILYAEQNHSMTTNTSTLTRSASLTHINLEDTINSELESTIICYQQALNKNSLVGVPVYLFNPNYIKKAQNIHKSASAIPSITNFAQTNSFDGIRNCLYQHKAVLSLIEPHLSLTKLHTILNSLTYKVSFDKKILLAYAHIKTHEKQTPFSESLLSYLLLVMDVCTVLRIISLNVYLTVLDIIHLWRRATDSKLNDKCVNDIVIDDTTV